MANSSLSSLFPMSIRLPTACEGAPPNSSALASSGSSLRTATAVGMAGSRLGRRLKKESWGGWGGERGGDGVLGD